MSTIDTISDIVVLSNPPIQVDDDTQTPRQNIFSYHPQGPMLIRNKFNRRLPRDRFKKQDADNTPLFGALNRRSGRQFIIPTQRRDELLNGLDTHPRRPTQFF